MPPDLRGYGVVLQKSGQAEEIIEGALRAGLFLPKPQLHKLQVEFRVKVPDNIGLYWVVLG